MDIYKEVRILKRDRFFSRVGSPCWILFILILITLGGCVPWICLPHPLQTRLRQPGPRSFFLLHGLRSRLLPQRHSASHPHQPPAPRSRLRIPRHIPTGSIEPTSVSLAASPTTDWNTASLPDCNLTAAETGVRIHTAPFIDPYHVLPTMEPGKSYPAVITKPTYTLLLKIISPWVGWITGIWRSLARVTIA